ncbi:hypothetical protein [Bradyrhizobium sp. SZCCHNS1054]|uniref:hypothetical protein n=1 Tax=Bradyrhizobium sp. SZCCHNS1054 TaxID=3057301 RepID=UPI0029170DBB|nr:hypothetical protein [Bradyrhizobium sp. SZCCHNS1054]
MVAITTATPYSAVASVLADATSLHASGAFAQQSSAAPNASSTSSAPQDTVDLSAHAKAILARAQAEQVAADKLSAQVRAARNSGANTGSSASASGDHASIFDQLSGQAEKASASSGDTSFLDDREAYQKSQQVAHTQADGTIQSWSTSASNVFSVPSTPQEIGQWYQTQGPKMLELAQAFPDSMPGLAEAIQNHTVTFTDARDIPGLNFHNSFTFQGGEGGSSGSSQTSFNSSLAMFQDPKVHYQIMDNGTVLSWPTSSAQQAAA